MEYNQSCGKSQAKFEILEIEFYMSTNTSSPQITITPTSALIDESVQILLSSFSPNVRVTLHAHTLDDANKEWVSQATFVTDENGSVDVSTQPPVAGTYHDADAMGLFWSLHLARLVETIPTLYKNETYNTNEYNLHSLG